MMEIGIGVQRVNSIKVSSQESTLPKADIEGFSSHLLGFVSNQNVMKTPITKQDSETFLINLEDLIGSVDLAGIGLTSQQIDDLAKVKELDISQIAEMIGVNVEEIKALYSELQTALLGTETEGPQADGEDDYDILLATLQLLQSHLTNDIKGLMKKDNPRGQGDGQGRVEDVIRLAKVIELFTQSRDMHITEASKANELKELMKNLQKGIESILTGMVNQSKDWSRLLKEAYTRQAIEADTQPAEAEANAIEKKSIQVQGNQIHFSLPKTETFSLNLGPNNKSLQYEQFVKEFQNILSKSNMVSQPNMSKLLIKLYPEQLGSLRIELLQHNGVMTAKILASTSTAKEMLDSQIQGLKHAFSSQNLQVEKIEISQTLSDTERQNKGQSQQQSSQHHKQPQSEQPGMTQEEAEQSFKDYLVNTEI
ncbi:flagellar hook-length control protein FliK [Rossellomorea aquimaris]|uniref:flagellar hook-length control protein FliK n=1 Tax=Rossellomorea aquimaris TaxID=189382 RepID=UPI001CFD3776|nr:flagellar hook-length control protein FliK [Rossellomorea aquimaris]